MDSGHHRQFHARLAAKSHREAVVALLNGWRGESNGGDYFFSGFMPVGAYDVGVVLNLANSANSSPIYRLPRVHSEERFGSYHSLLESVISEFFSDIRNSLYRPNPEIISIYEGRSSEELLRKAADRLMETPIWASNSIEGLYGLYNSCNIIASMNYESEEGNGGMLVARNEHPNVDVKLSFKSPVPLREHRSIRKLLEMATDKYLLISDGKNVVGLGSATGVYDEGLCDIFKINFISHHKWELLHHGHRMMRVEYGIPKLPREPIDREKFLSDLQRTIGGIGDQESKDIFEVALRCCRQAHGTILVISKDAEQEAIRLSSESTLITPVKLESEIVERITSIDGALMVGVSGYCYAIGVILDGVANNNGDSSRGARYNSAVRYLANKQNTLVLIISEDGTAEWIPFLRPMLTRNELSLKVNELDELLSLDEVDENQSRKVLNWFFDHSFYLPELACEKVNELQSRFHTHMISEGAIAIDRPKLSPHPDMNDSYLK